MSWKSIKFSNFGKRKMQKYPIQVFLNIFSIVSYHEEVIKGHLLDMDSSQALWGNGLISSFIQFQLLQASCCPCLFDGDEHVVFKNE